MIFGLLGSFGQRDASLMVWPLALFVKLSGSMSYHPSSKTSALMKVLAASAWGAEFLVAGVGVSNSIRSRQLWLNQPRQSPGKALTGLPNCCRSNKKESGWLPGSRQLGRSMHRKSMLRIWVIFSSSIFTSNYSSEVSWFNLHAFFFGGGL